VGELRNALARVYHPKTVNHWLIACWACRTWGIKKGLVPSNPFRELKLLEAKGRERTITNEEFGRLLAGADEVFRPVLLFLRYTPARPGVVRQLRCEHLDAECKLITLHDTKRSRTSKVREPWKIGVPDELRPVIQDLVKRRGGVGHVFLNEDGQPWRKDALVLRMRRLRERVGLGADAQGEQLVLDHGRHTFLTGASYHIPGPMLAALADHTGPRSTRRYLHHALEEILKATQRVAQAIGGK
jgi:integrase